MELKFRILLVQGQQRRVADEYGVHSGIASKFQYASRLSKLLFEDIDVQGQVDTYTLLVRMVDSVRKRFGSKILGATAGIQLGETQVDGTSPSLHSSLQSCLITGGCEQLQRLYGDICQRSRRGIVVHELPTEKEEGRKS
jgi:hypothetical protein